MQLKELMLYTQKINNFFSKILISYGIAKTSILIKFDLKK